MNKNLLLFILMEPNMILLDRQLKCTNIVFVCMASKATYTGLYTFLLI